MVENMISNKFLTFLLFSLLTAVVYAQDNAIPIEAEDADSLGSDFNIVTEGEVTFITPSTDFASPTSPETPDKVATYEITFAAPGTYDLYVKLRVGPEAYNDDSFYFASSFGNRPADTDALWIRVNNIGNGAADPDEYVLGPEENSAGNEIFKWINASETGEGAAGGTLFVVEEDSLTQIFQIGSREDGLDIDKIAFGNADLFYTVSNLENGEAGVSEIPETGTMLIVDLSDSLRPVTHCATGALYGVTETIPNNIAGLVAPLRPYVYVHPALAGTGHQQPSGAAIPVSARLASTTGQVMIRLADICPNWPYSWPGSSSWLSQVSSVINDKIASGRNNYYGYEIWNEHHGTWNSSNGDWYTVLWEPTYNLIRSADPGAKIIGPSDSYYSRSRIEEFLMFCIDRYCLPDIICWHELQGSANITSHIDDYRDLVSSLSISELPISINEYCHPTHEYEGCPGTSAPFIAKFERNKVHSASISWWFTNLPGRLGSLLTSSIQKGGGWWFYKWYGDMSGYMVRVTPPNDYSDGIDGFACLDTNAQYASICLGGDDTEIFDVMISGIPSSFGDSVYTKVEYVPWTSKDTPVSGPTIVSNTVYSVSNGAITVPVDVTSPFYGYRVYISPTNTLTFVDNSTNIAPAAYSLSQNYPNPFNPTTNIEYSIPISGQMSLKVYNSLGQAVATLFEGHQRSGTYVAKFNASGLASGVYIYRLEFSNTYLAKKFILMK
jgi:hypothetical protein